MLTKLEPSCIHFSRKILCEGQVWRQHCREINERKSQVSSIKFQNWDNPWLSGVKYFNFTWYHFLLEVIFAPCAQQNIGIKELLKSQSRFWSPNAAGNKGVDIAHVQQVVTLLTRVIWAAAAVHWIWKTIRFDDDRQTLVQWFNQAEKNVWKKWLIDLSPFYSDRGQSSK